MRLCVPHSHTHIDTRTLIHVCISISLFFVVFFFFFHYSRCCIWYLLYSLAFPEPQCEQSSAGLLLIVSGIFNRVFITCVSSLALPRSDNPPPLSLCTPPGLYAIIYATLCRVRIHLNVFCGILWLLYRSLCVFA